MARQQFAGNLRQAPAWLKDFGDREHIIAFPAKLDPAQFTDAAGVTVTVDTGGAAQNATSIPVVALTPNSALWNTIVISAGIALIPAGSVLYFGGAKVAKLTADAKIGDTALTVAALPTALVAGDAALFSRYGTLAVPGGILVGRTFTERDANTNYGPATVASDDEQFLTVFDSVDLNNDNNVELVRHNSLIAENFLPGYGTGLLLGTSAAPTATLTKIRALYQCISGAQ